MVLAFRQPWNVEVKREHWQRLAAWMLLAGVFGLLSYSIVARRYAIKKQETPCHARTASGQCVDKPGVATLPIARP